MPRIDLVQRQRAAEGGEDFLRIVPTAGADGLERGHAEFLTGQIAREQRGQDGFARASVSAGDEEDLAQTQV